MAWLFASLAVSRALDTLTSFLPASLAVSSSSTASRARQEQDLEDLRMLERTMRRIHATLDEAEQQWNIREESAKLRLEELKELAYDAEEVVEKYEYEVTRRKVEAFDELAVVQGDGSSSKRQEVNDGHYSVQAGIVPIPCELAARTKEIIERFSEIKDYSDIFTLSENDGDRRIFPDINNVRQTSSFVFAPIIVGREQDKEKIIKKVLAREGSRVGGRMSVLAIVGMGGLGKTTLAQLVYNDPTVRQSFDFCGWVCVSEYFDVMNITRKIISSLTKENCDYIQSGELQGALENLIMEKRVLLVLDDVWNERSDYWELLCVPKFASTRCDTIVTTRNEAVAKLVQTMPLYNVNCLRPDDSWLLFKQSTFVEQENVSPANLVEIGRRIAENCKGLPLALKTLGSVLRFETNIIKWRDVLESELWDSEQSQNEVLPALELSYKHMPMHLKLCFVSLSLYPKGTYLDESIVVWLWKSLHLLQCDGTDNRDEIGCLHFTELVQRSLLQGDIHGNMVMHNLVHDLTCFLAGEEFFRLEGDKQIKIPRGARYLSIVPQAECKKSIQISNDSQSLRVIIKIWDIDIENPKVLFLNCKKFRIIEMDDSFSKVLLDCIGGMKLPRHFTFTGSSNVVQLVISSSMSHLFNLQTLDCEPYNLHGIGRLVNLQILPKIHLCKCGCFFNIRELMNMNKIRKLHIYGLCDVSSIRDVNEAHLHSKKDLEILELDFNEWKRCEHKESTNVNQAIITVSGGSILENLRPHHQSLRVLRLKNFNCEIYPSWLGSASFSKLTELLLQNCQWKNLPTLGGLPSLKSLYIRQMECVDHIGQQFCSVDRTVKGFHELRYLSFHDMYRLSEWFGVEDTLPSVPFLTLRKFTLIDCGNLVTFPASATLQELNISNCEKLKELPNLPSLQSFYLLNCSSLVTFGHFPSLTILDLQDPFKEEILHRLMNSHLTLEDVSICSRTLKSICLEPQSLPSLRSLELRCPNLQHCDALASLTSLKKLNINGSPQLHVPNSLRSQLENLYTAESF